MGSDGTNDPPFERLDLDMSSPVDREIARGLQRARGERLAARGHQAKLDHIGREERAKLKQAGQEFEAKRQSGGRSRSRSRTRG